MVAAVILQSTASAMLNKIKYASLILGSKVLNQSQRNAFTKRMSEVESVARQPGVEASKTTAPGIRAKAESRGTVAGDKGWYEVTRAYVNNKTIINSGRTVAGTTTDTRHRTE
ncbi:hypothetical protein CBL_13973 [Carabus blaptoides fortunei]